MTGTVLRAVFGRFLPVVTGRGRPGPDISSEQEELSHLLTSCFPTGYVSTCQRAPSTPT